MKWFEHECDALEHPKHKKLLKEFGAEGYLVCFGTWEKIGKYGDKYLRLSLEKYPKTLLADAFSVSIDRMEKVWTSMCKVKLLSSNHLKNNILYSSKLKERCDEYQKKLQRKSRQAPDTIHVDKNTLQQITTEYITLKKYNNELLASDDYARIGKAIKQLYAKSKQNANLIIEGLRWLSEQGYEWTLETLIKKWPDFITHKDEPSKQEAYQLLEDAKQDLGKLGGKEPVLEWLNKLPPYLHGKLKLWYIKHYSEDHQGWYDAEEEYAKLERENNETS